MENIIVAIPYLRKKAQGKELEYSIAGWKRHFFEKFTLVIIGDYDPVIDRYHDVVHIDCKQVPGIDGEYTPALDIVNKMITLHKHFPDCKGFVWSADDIYSVNNFDINDIRFLKALEPTMNDFGINNKNPWQRMMARTRELLMSHGYHTRNFATHLPCWYEWDKIFTLIDRFRLDSHSYSIQSMYYNIFFGDRIPFYLSENDNIKLGVYTSKPDKDKIAKALQTKIWLNNSTIGFVPELNVQLEKHYKYDSENYANPMYY